MAGSKAFLLMATLLVAAGAAGAAAATIGVCYGTVADNLPSPSQVVSLLKSRGVQQVKIYDAAGDVLSAFANSGIQLSIAVTNQEVAGIADSQSTASSWVQSNVLNYAPATKIGSIAVGNEYLSDSSNDMSKLVPAMQNIQQALNSAGLGSIKVSTPLGFDVMGDTYPPSAGAFSGTFTSSGVIQGILSFLHDTNSVFMINVYPYFSYSDNSAQINLDYALFNPNAPTVYDSGSGLTYTNLFDAMVDSVFAAMNGLGYGGLSLEVTESGWPSAGGGVGVSIANAQTYNNNLVQHVLQHGTPRQPSARIPTYIFALFNEDKKTGAATENNFGLYYPNEQPVYSTTLSA